MKFRSDLPRDEIFREFSKFFSLRGWSVSTAYDTVSAEDGRNYSLGLIILLIILGIPALFLFLIGIALWIFAAAYYIAADKHRVKLAYVGDGIFETHVNSTLAGEALSQFISLLEKEGKAAQVLPEPLKPTAEKMYDELLRAYAVVYGASAKMKLEKDIEKVMKEKGLSRGDAIEALYRGA